MEPPFEQLPGVVSVTSGYIGGKTENPSYEEVSRGGTGHAEAVRIVYDPAKISYAQLLDVFWLNIDPVDAGGQFCDRGSQYRSGIFYLSEQQKLSAEQSKAKLAEHKRFSRVVVTEIAPSGTFYPAEDYHQDFYKKNPARYYTYRTGCGRDRRLQQLWGKRPY
jgi:peptide-methionine (S)-S-oxide reductase